MSILQIRQALQKHASRARAATNKRFFKTGPGQYAATDTFLGVSASPIRKISRQYKQLPRKTIKTLLYSPIHEERQLALYILVLQFQKGNQQERQAVYDYYLTHIGQVNNWDLVDSSASHIIGAYLYERDKAFLHELAHATHLWKRRISIVATHYFIRKKDYDTTLNIAETLLTDTHDLIHKAVGWMLREVGKQDEKQLLAFLDQHAYHMPRTMLRYAIERLPQLRRKHYMAL